RTHFSGTAVLHRVQGMYNSQFHPSDAQEIRTVGKVGKRNYLRSPFHFHDAQVGFIASEID
ncbi:MAG: hypothetical protein ACYC9O_20255, partial [Candidatus Latescibacterota bacterium]